MIFVYLGMKATIEFDLNDPDERGSFELYNKSLDMGLLIWELVHNKKKELYDQDEPIDYLYNWLYDEMESRGININNLVK